LSVHFRQKFRISCDQSIFVTTERVTEQFVLTTWLATKSCDVTNERTLTGQTRLNWRLVV